jgi:tetratricopeptide (TPR) repeat protein
MTSEIIPAPFRLRVLISTVFGLVMASSATADIITLKVGRRINGEIIQSTPQGIVVSVNDKEQEVPADNIDFVQQFTDEPNDLQAARKYINEQNYSRVLGKLDEIPKDDLPKRKMLLQELEYCRVVATAKLALSGEAGTVKDAGSAMSKFLKNPELSGGYHYYEAVSIFGELLLAADLAKNAEAEFKKIVDSGVAGFVPDGLIRMADSQLAQTNIDGAMESYEKVLALEAKPEYQQSMLLAQVGKANCLTEKGDTTASIEMLNKIIADTNGDDAKLFARLYNALGRSHLKAGNSKDALFAFLYTDVRYSADPNLHAEALYHLVKLWEADLHPERAKEAQQLLKSPAYQATRWAKME